FPIPRSINPRVPELIERVILKATAKDPDDRFASVAEMNIAFQAALAHTLDPENKPAPLIPCVQPDDNSKMLPSAENVPVQGKSRRFRAAAIVALLLLFALGIPLAYASLSDSIYRTPNQAAMSALAIGDLNSAKVTALAGTIEAMSTSGSEGGFVLAPSLTATPTLGEDGDPILYGSPTPTYMNDPPPGSPDNPLPSESSTAASLPPSTPSPTPTITPMSTSTPTTPPLPSPTIDVCSTLALSGFSISGQEVSWNVFNGGTQAVKITSIYLNWPGSNVSLKKIYLDGNMLWQGNDKNPPTTISSGWETSGRTIAPGSSKRLSFFFDQNAALSAYALTITMDNGCAVSANN
ncbi:MAG: hypothetical protein MUP44_13675, partial [Anaerolineales bacterium]|nr:hypothetical protein [Anaerolineales bacterium]